MHQIIYTNFESSLCQAVNHLHYLVCSPTSKCSEGKGHCNVDADCSDGLRCGRKNCIKDELQNCCYRPIGKCFVLRFCNVLILCKNNP